MIANMRVLVSFCKIFRKKNKNKTMWHKLSLLLESLSIACVPLSHQTIQKLPLGKDFKSWTQPKFVAAHRPTLCPL